MSVYDAGPKFTSAEGKEGKERAKKIAVGEILAQNASPSSCNTVSRYMDMGSLLFLAWFNQFSHSLGQLFSESFKECKWG